MSSLPSYRLLAFSVTAAFVWWRVTEISAAAGACLGSVLMAVAGTRTMRRPSRPRSRRGRSGPRRGARDRGSSWEDG